MRRYLISRLAQTLVVVLFVTTASFVLVHLAPGDPFATEDWRVSEATRERWRAEFGLDQPLPQQYVRYVANLARGNLGYSFSHRRPVADAIGDALPRTLLLVGVGGALALLGGVALGLYQAVRRGRPVERAVSGVTLVAYSLPDFWVAILLLLLFANWLPLFPAGGVIDPVMHDYMGPWDRVVDRVRHLVLPAGTLALITAAGVARYQRSALLEVLGSDFLRTARAKGMSERAAVLRHGLRNALLPVITLAGLLLPALVGGAVFVEKVFSWNGMGLLAVNAIASRDYPLVTASVAVGGIIVAVGSLLADVLYAVADPRLRDG